MAPQSYSSSSSSSSSNRFLTLVWNGDRALAKDAMGSINDGRSVGRRSFSLPRSFGEPTAVTRQRLIEDDDEDDYDSGAKRPPPSS